MPFAENEHPVGDFGPSREHESFRPCSADLGRWKIIQCHLSVGAANQDVVGKELTV